MSLTIDWKTQANNRSKYPTGSYKVELTGWEEVKASTGTQQIRWFADIRLPSEFDGKSIIDHTPLTEASLWKIANLVQACGIDLTEVVDKMIVGSPAFKAILDSCVGRTTYWNVQFDEQYQNNKVIDYLEDTAQEKIAPKVLADTSPFGDQ